MTKTTDKTASEAIAEAKAAEDETFHVWGLLELLGHRQLLGEIQEVEVAGAKMLRIDVLGEDGKEFKATQYYASAAVYGITPMTEESVRKRQAVMYTHLRPALAYNDGEDEERMF